MFCPVGWSACQAGSRPCVRPSSPLSRPSPPPPPITVGYILPKLSCLGKTQPTRNSQWIIHYKQAYSCMTNFPLDYKKQHHDKKCLCWIRPQRRIMAKLYLINFCLSYIPCQHVGKNIFAWRNSKNFGLWKAMLLSREDLLGYILCKYCV